MVRAKKTRDSYMLERGAWPYPMAYDSFQRRKNPAVLAIMPMMATHLASLAGMALLNIHAAI